MTWKELRIQFESMIMAMNPNYEFNGKLTTDKLNAVLDQLYHMCIDRRIQAYDNNPVVSEDLRPLVKEVYIPLNLKEPPNNYPKYLPDGKLINTNLMRVSVPDDDINRLIGSEMQPLNLMNWEVYQNIGLRLIYKNNFDEMDTVQEWELKKIPFSAVNNFLVQDGNYPYIPHPVYTSTSWLENKNIKYDIFLDPELVNISKLHLDNYWYYDPEMYVLGIRVVTHQKFYGVNTNYDDTDVLVSFIDEILNVALSIVANQPNPDQ